MIRRIVPNLFLIAVLMAATHNWSALAAPSEKTYVVNTNTNDPDTNPGDGICLTSQGQCSLRAALQEANLETDPSRITFASKYTIGIADDFCFGVGDHETTIDASSQWDGTWPGGSPGVNIIRLVSTDTCIMSLASNDNRVYGLGFIGGKPATLTVAGDDNVIGGLETGQRNVFLPPNSTSFSIFIQGRNNSVIGNYFGTEDGLTALSGTSHYAIDVAGPGVNIRNNLIVAQGIAGIRLRGASSAYVSNNIIGLNKTLQDKLPNGIGIVVNPPGSANQILLNVIGGSTGDGILIDGAGGNTVSSNTIGSQSLGNGSDGVRLNNAPNNLIEGNNIAYNTGNGVGGSGSIGAKIYENIIHHNGYTGVWVPGSSATIGSSTQRNYIYSNAGDGIRVSGALLTGVNIKGNYIGLSQDGCSDRGNLGYGVRLDDGANWNTVGGNEEGEANYIAFNDAGGIMLDGNDTMTNFIFGNIIGAPAASNCTWTAGNDKHGVGIYNGAHANFIGWTKPNMIVSSTWSGVAIVNASNNFVWSNLIGIDARGNNRGNAMLGVGIVGNSSNNDLASNVIAYNGSNGNQAGVSIDGVGADGNSIRWNSIYDNGGAGIELINGGNNNQAAPAISQAACDAPVSGTACANCYVQIYSDAQDEGKYFEGQVTADSSGKFTFTEKFHGPNVTAITTNPGTSDSSKFSTPFNTGACLYYDTFLPLVKR